jgi:phage terminase large subunit
MHSKLDGIQAARTTLQKAIFHPRTEELGIAALEQYRREWDDEKKTYRANEVHDWACHPADAFRYLALSWRNVPEIYVEPARVLQPGQVPLPPPPEPSRGGRIRI